MPRIFTDKMQTNTLIKLLEAYPEKPWSWFRVSYNPNLTMEFIEKHPELPWDWQSISENNFLYHPYFSTDSYRKYMACKISNIVKEELISVTCHPRRLFNWNEDSRLIFPDEYQKEESKWRAF